MFHCPFYNSYDACATFTDCVFRRDSGCVLVISAESIEEEKEKVKEIEQRLSRIENALQALLDRFR